MHHRLSKAPICLAITLMAILITPDVGLSWGHLAHRVTARMAQERLTPSALTAVQNLLGPEISLADISAWADSQREVPGTATWHYVNVPLTESRYDPKYCPPAGCVVGKIIDFKAVLQNPKAEMAAKQKALKFLVHFVQDLHSPVHVGDVTGSKGGNLIQVRFGERGTNLHALWDSGIINWHSIDEAQWQRELAAMITPDKIAEWSKGTVEDWATESLEAAKVIFSLPGSKEVIQSGSRIGGDYCLTVLPILQVQLAKAAVRVATELNAVFEPLLPD